ncbi:MAG: autotransporter-associated beta strand repeat-containing protein, partial [Bacteroidota bacterium]|nr:autotransporter-associated beta strand repeat-containing protein [Bacteroidota bacterium]
MKQKLSTCFLILLLICGWAGPLSAQRKMEKLGRGVVAVNNGGGSVYVSWRLLATDPQNIGFNVYRSINGAEVIKLNSTPITATTDYTDNSASTSATNSYFVKPVLNGVETTASKPFTIQGNATAKRYQAITLKPTTYSTSVQHVYPGDLDGDGEYDYVVKRQPRDPANNVLLEAYTHEGAFMWRIDLGRNMEQGAGTHNPFVVVYDFNGDGKAEVFTRSGELTVFADGNSITDTNGGNKDGVDDYRTLPPTSDMGYMLLGDNCPEYLSMVDGMTGKELARREWIDRGAKSTWTSLWGDGYGHRMNMNFIGVAYLDGVNPCIVTSRGDGGIMDIEAYDFDGTNINSRWTWSARTNTAKPAGQTWKQFHASCLNGTATNAGIPTGYHWADFHNIRVADLDGDGKDEISWGVNAIDDNGTPLYFAKNDIGHGDRFVISDLDPDRPGLECYAIQQAASTLAVYYDAKNGERIKTWSAVPSYDVGRGDAADIDPNVKGCELWSYAHSTLLNCKGDAVPGATSYPAPALTMWWDGDLQREILSAADGNGYNPIINKWNPSTNSAGRLLSLYSEGGAYSNKIPYGGRPALYSDVMGDWREEIFCMNSDSTEMRIFSTWTPASTRIYCLMQNPEYRSCANIKGYMTSTEVDYYLGGGMTRPPMPPVLSSNTQWKGGANGNAWDINTTSNWLNNTTLKTFNQGDTVLFDISGKTNNTVNLSGEVQPGQVWVSSPVDYTFTGTGAIAGNASLLKTGYGALILSNTNSYTGTTTVDQGSLIVNGVLTQSPVWVNRQAILGGIGTLSQTVTMETGAILSPAKNNVAGTLKFAKNLTIPTEAIYQLDMSDDATGQTRASDSIKVNGDVVLSGTLNVKVNQLNGKLSVGNYTIMTFTGAFTGTLSNIIVTGINDNKYSVINTGSAIVIKIEASRDPGNIAWSGSNSTWDLLTTQSWLINGSPALFATGDSVFFNATGKANPNVVLTGTLNIGNMEVDASENNYTFSGTGSIIGNGGITKTGKGKLTLSTSNAYTGKTIINGGALEVSTLANIGLNSSIGAAATTDPLYLQLTDSRLRYAGSTQQSTDRGMTITGTDTIETANSAGSIVLNSPVVGTGKLVKTGAGKLIYNGVNTYTGNTVIKEGAIN